MVFQVQSNTVMAVSLAMKRQAEDILEATTNQSLLDAAGHHHQSLLQIPTSLHPIAIQRSPVKLLNTIQAPKAKKRREESPLLNNNVGVENLENGNSDSESIDLKPDNKGQLNGGSLPVPAVNGHCNLPCIWLGGNTSPKSSCSPAKETSPAPQQPAPAPPPLPPPSEGSAGSPHPLRTPPRLVSSSDNHNDSLHSDGELNGDATGDDSLPMEVCPECHKVFKRRVYLQRHMEREHWSTAKVFKCEDCSYETKHQSNLSVHRRTHTGERPYHCGACGQRYTQGHLLKSHIRSRHGGNMELYNLDKKTDSTRGRKSLDLKHEIPGIGSRPDKISQLLQAAAAGARVSQPLQLPHPHPPKFSNMLSPTTSQYLSALSPYFTALRPMMTPPLPLSANMFANHRFLGLGNMPNGLPTLPTSLLATMQQGLPLLSKQPFGLPPVSVAEELNNTGIKIPLKIPEVPNPTPFQNRSPKAKEEESQPPAVPEDLTVKKEPVAAVAPRHFDSRCSEPQDLSCHFYLKSESDGPAVPKRQTPPVPETAMTPEPRSSPVQLDDTPMDYSPVIAARDYVQDDPDDDAMTASTPDPEDDSRSIETGMPKLLATPVQCEGLRCVHAKQLRSLRQCVYRMLSVFTPDLSVGNGMDLNSDQVDQLLHEVIYSNLDDNPSKKA